MNAGGPTVDELQRRDPRDVHLVDELVDLLLRLAPFVRAERVAAARDALAQGHHPSAEVVAGTMLETARRGHASPG